MTGVLPAAVGGVMHRRFSGLGEGVPNWAELGRCGYCPHGERRAR